MALWHGQVVLASVMGKWYRQVLWAGDTGKTLLDDTVVRASIWASGMGKWYGQVVWASGTGKCCGQVVWAGAMGKRHGQVVWASGCFCELVIE
jgi:hypothetical protein